MTPELNEYWLLAIDRDKSYGVEYSLYATERDAQAAALDYVNANLRDVDEGDTPFTDYAEAQIYVDEQTDVYLHVESLQLRAPARLTTETIETIVTEPTDR